MIIQLEINESKTAQIPEPFLSIYSFDEGVTNRTSCSFHIEDNLHLAPDWSRRY